MVLPLSQKSRFIPLFACPGKCQWKGREPPLSEARLPKLLLVSQVPLGSGPAAGLQITWLLSGRRRGQGRALSFLGTKCVVSAVSVAPADVEDKCTVRSRCPSPVVQCAGSGQAGVCPAGLRQETFLAHWALWFRQASHAFSVLRSSWCCHCVCRSF